LKDKFLNASINAPRPAETESWGISYPDPRNVWEPACRI